MQSRYLLRFASLLLALSVGAGPARAETVEEGAKVGQWKTWVLASGSEIAVPAPPAADSDQTKAELAELRQLQALRSPLIDQVIASWNDGPATGRWTELALKQPAANPLRAFRMFSNVHAAMHDAVVAAYQARYTHNRSAPAAVESELSVAASLVNGPSYPSEHAAVAAAAAGVLAYFYPAEAEQFQALAREAGNSRLLAGANYRSDVEAGTALGQAIAQKVIARAMSDNSDAPFTGTRPTGPQYWTGTVMAEPAAGTWKTWILASGSQVRPGPPPALDSDQFQAELAEVKRIRANPTALELALAQFWGTNLGPFWQAASTLIARDQLSTPAAARVLALMTIAMADSTIAVWDSKFHYWHLRPYEADPTITTLVPPPPYPTYAGGFASVTYIMGEVLAHFFPQDATSLREMVTLADHARIYQGIHYRHDNVASHQIAGQVVRMGIERIRTNGN
jgi:membrane-associated phospholipid phosphatase